MTTNQEKDKSLSQPTMLESRFIVVANIFPSKSRYTIKIVDLSGHLLGIALREEILALLDGKLDHVNVVLYRVGETKP